MISQPEGTSTARSEGKPYGAQHNVNQPLVAKPAPTSCASMSRTRSSTPVVTEDGIQIWPADGTK